MGRRTTGMSLSRLRLPAAVASVGTSTALLVAVGVLGGCDSPETPPPPASSPSASATSAAPSPSTTAPSPSVGASVEIPAAAREKSDEGAEAFVRFFFDQVNQAWTEPASGLVTQQSEGGCQFCLRTESDAAKLVQSRERYVADPITLTSVAAVSGAAPEGQSFVLTDATQNRVDVVDAGDSAVRSDSKKDLRLMTGLIWKGGRWFVFEVEER